MLIVSTVLFWGLEVGSWADWFGAVGTILAVIVAVLAPYYVNRPKVKTSQGSDYYTPSITLRNLRVKALNVGRVPIKITDLGFNIGNTGQHFGVQENISEYLQQNDDVEGNIKAADVIISLTDKFPNQKMFVLVPYARSSQGKYYKGKPLKYSRKQMDKDLDAILALVAQ
ncbi:hypothetical protein NVV78_08425 [Pediococcus ethanolidurans]|uniref:hypothetical protein n=1 Tax=Pediococcus ethanolidurans TaxID=319653 RepID=UPI0021E7AAF1|nr:hypothetical protein [Pediococcus ethanolidurans]MCV3315963.1 hypothetical protein [Pediococcus ethanolidurans]